MFLFHDTVKHTIPYALDDAINEVITHTQTMNVANGNIHLI